MPIRKISFLVALFISTVIFFPVSFCSANNLSIANVSLSERDAANNSVKVKFDISWDNAWKSKINHDAVWLTVRLYDASAVYPQKVLCDLKTSGLAPTGTSVGSNTNIEIYVPSDKKGAFLRYKNFTKTASLASTGVQLTLDYSTCGFNQDSNVYVSLLGIEMVYVPQGSFYAGDFNGSTAALNQGSVDSDPWAITGEDAISVANPASDGYRYVSGGNPGEDSTGSSFTVPAEYPKGYNPFYVMKYEITEGQWAEFINSLDPAARLNRDVTDTNHKNSDAVQFRNTLSCSGTPLTCSTSRPARAASFLTWMDVAAFLDWAALRPMTELEFEKTARGPLLPVSGEYAWGSTTVVPATTISNGAETGSETITNSGANVNYNNTTFTGGDADGAAESAQGPLRVGIFATASATRQSSGAGYYGVMELSGNVKERVATLGNSTGRNFTGLNGDGVLTTAVGFEGNANQSAWPGLDQISASQGVTGAAGSGFRGGSWASGALDPQKISNRSEAALNSSSASNDSGGRGVRTYDGS